MKIQWMLILLVLFIILSIFVAPILLSNQGILSITDFINLLSIVFSWPTAVLSISIIFFTRFHESINSLLKNIGSMKFPGGFEFQRQDQMNLVAEVDSKAKDVLTASNENKLNEIKENISEIDPEEELSKNDVQLINKQQSELINAVKFWKYSYFNQFFVQQTKNVLIWFSRSLPQTRQSYDTIWSPYIMDQNQRNTILSVLLQNGMLSENNGLIQITDEGQSFLQHFGYIPSAKAG